ncbi:MAG: penicillin-binding protein 2 [Actinobacteria bacterium]|nr:penicillin-binding protein 2 [Actinomycetota bacterium]
MAVATDQVSLFKEVGPGGVTREGGRPHGFRLRVGLLSTVLLLVFSALFARLWFLQVMAGERYVALAQDNATRTVSLEAPRGRILDRHGKALVTTRYAMVVTVQSNELGPHPDAVLRELADLLGISQRQLRSRIDNSRAGPLWPAPVLVDAPRRLVFYLHENAEDFPGVRVEQRPLRRYPHGSLAAHVVGYVGEINEEELDRKRYRGYDPGDLIGWGGVEATHESQLRGIKGTRRAEVDAQGRILRELGGRAPTPGRDLRLTIDLRTQRLAERALDQGLAQARGTGDSERGGTYAAPAGAVVVLDPRNGELLALASNPSFSPARFVGGVGDGYWKALHSKSNHYPLINRTLQSAYPPGSVWKVVPAAAALRHGFMSTSSTLPCPASFSLGSATFNNWSSTDMGSMDIQRALTMSCDTVFYQLGTRMWMAEGGESGRAKGFMTAEGERFGFGALTGVDLPYETDGTVPGRRWKREYWRDNRDSYCKVARSASSGAYERLLYAELCSDGWVWRGGDAVNMSIGQGDVQTSPLQLANAYAAIANGGTRYRPHVVKAVIGESGRVRKVRREVIGRVPLRPEHLAEIRNGLVGVTSAGGTAGTPFAGFDVPVAGKTGTAENKPLAPYAWFVSYAPANAPRYVVVAMVEQGGGGSLNAAPIVRQVYEGLFARPGARRPG